MQDVSNKINPTESVLALKGRETRALDLFRQLSINNQKKINETAKRLAEK